MPTYEYECPDCGLQYERSLKLAHSDEPQFCCGVVSVCEDHGGDREETCNPCRVSKECTAQLERILPSSYAMKPKGSFTPGLVARDGKKYPTKRNRGVGDYG